ncbi:MAG: hypothetical protein ACR2ON_07690 [Paracoccaceae bacterium]
MKQSTINSTTNQVCKRFDSNFGINNWCLYNQEEQSRTSLIVRGEAGFYRTTWSFNDDYIREIHKEMGISDEDVTDIICSSMFNITDEA